MSGAANAGLLGVAAILAAGLSVAWKAPEPTPQQAVRQVLLDGRRHERCLAFLGADAPVVTNARLDAATLARLPDGEKVGALLDHAEARAKERPDAVARWPQGLRDLYAIGRLEADLRDGGFAKFFEHDSGDEVLAALGRLGSDERSRALELAMRVRDARDPAGYREAERLYLSDHRCPWREFARRVRHQPRQFLEP